MTHGAQTTILGKDTPKIQLPGNRQLTLPEELFHDEYIRQWRAWLFYRAAYKGGPDYAGAELPDGNSTLVRYSARESEEDYGRRSALAHYPNYCKAIVSLKTSHVFRPGVDRELGENEDFAAFLQDVDRRGTSADEFWREVAEHVGQVGIHWVGIDVPSTPSAPEGPRSLADQMRLGVRPYIYHIRRENLVDWSVVTDPNSERFGHLDYVCVLDSQLIRHPFQPSKVSVRVTKWTAFDWQRFIIDVDGDGDARIEDLTPDPMTPEPVPHEWGQVPIVPVIRFEEGTLSGHGDLQDLAFLNNLIFNHWSHVTQLIRDQSFSVFVVKDEAASDFGEQPEENVDLGPTNAFVGDAKFVGPDSSYVGATLETIRAVREEMYRVARMGNMIATQASSREKSGVAHAFEFQETQVDLRTFAASLEDAETRIYRLWAKAHGLDWDEAGGQVRYSQHFDIQSLQEDMAVAERFINVGIGPTGEHHELMKAWRKANPRARTDVEERVSEEILRRREAEAAVALAPAPGFDEGEDEL